MGTVPRNIDPFREILSNIENNLDSDDLVPLMFLLYNSNNMAMNQMMQIRSNNGMKQPLTNWFTHVQATNPNAQEMLAVALYVTQNFREMGKLGYNSNSELWKQQFCSLELRFINPVKKVLYHMCESLDTEDQASLVQYMHAGSQCPVFKDMEMYILYWNEMGYIKIDGDVDLSRLVQFLKSSNMNDVAMMLSAVQGLPQYHPRSLQRNNNVKAIHGGLCVIVNQKNFVTLVNDQGKEYHPGDRIGTDVDRDKLVETFVMFGFDVVVLQNATFEEMMEVPPGVKGKKYPCLVACFLSHGDQEGSIMDGTCHVAPLRTMTASLKEAYKDVMTCGCIPKIFVIGACDRPQFQKARVCTIRNPSHPAGGSRTCPESCETMIFNSTDSEDGSTIIFSATVEGYAVIREFLKGTWFIQEFCNALLRNPGVGLREVQGEIAKEMKNKRGRSNGEEVCQVPSFSSSTSDDVALKFSPSGVIKGITMTIGRTTFELLLDEYLRSRCGSSIFLLLQIYM